MATALRLAPVAFAWGLAFGLLAAPAAAQGPLAVRVATFNIHDVRSEQVRDPSDERLRQIAEVLQRLRPNVVLLNELAYDIPGGPGVPAGQESAGENARLFIENFLSRPQAEGLEPLAMRAFAAPVNSGMPSGFDLDGDGEIVTAHPPPAPSPDGAGLPLPAGAEAYAGDCWGYGTFPGQYGMALLVDERLEILADRTRTFRLMPWNYMSAPLSPQNENGEPLYDEEAWALFRLSSKSHWDVPVRLPNGAVLHVLASHPTPPAFDGDSERNRRRNHDEIRFWADYIQPQAYMVDDQGRQGGLRRGELFVIVGDLNADPDEGASLEGAIGQLLEHDRIGEDRPPRAVGELGSDLLPDETAAWGMRVDYVLPSRSLERLGAGVWRHPPALGEGFPSDHFPVWVDLVVPAPPERERPEQGR